MRSAFSSIWPGIILAAFSGAAFSLAFPPLQWWLLGPVGLCPLILLCQNAAARRALLYGSAWGAALELARLNWLVYVMTVFGGLPAWLAWATLLLFSLILSSYSAIFAWLLSRAKGRAPAVVLMAAPGWMALEWLREVLFTGFPWLPLSASVSAALPLVQSAEIWGSLGVSGLLALLAALAAIFIGAMARGAAADRKAWAALAAFGIICGLLWGWGEARLSQVRPRVAAAPTLPVSVVQGNTAIGDIMDHSRAMKVTRSMAGLTEQALQGRERRPWLVVWPESGSPFYFTHDAAPTLAVLNLARDLRAHIFTGTIGLERGEENRPLVSNRSWLVGPDGRAGPYYDKVHLVPFGEYVPLSKVLFFVRAIARIGDDFARGDAGHTIAMNGVDLGPLICYESIFPELARAQVAAGATLLVNQTNDGWFGPTAASRQHMLHLVWRAVENRVAAARAANTGISAFVLPDGQVVRETGMYVPAWADCEVPLLSGGTFYTRHGGWLGPLAVLFALLAAALLSWGPIMPKPKE